MHQPPSPAATVRAAEQQKPTRRALPLRTNERRVTPHQRFPVARLLETTKAPHGVTVHLWTPTSGRINFTAPHVVYGTPADPDKLVSVHIDVDGAAHIEALHVPPLLPPPAAIEQPLRVSREAVLASIEAPQTPAVEALLAGLPAGVRVGIAASTLFDYAMADIRQSLGMASFLPVGEAGVAAQDAHNATAYSQANRASRSSYLGIDARFLEPLRWVFSSLLARARRGQGMTPPEMRSQAIGTWLAAKVTN